ncbi:hypothetical protein BDZ91DRAFT_711858 [Kalaharituber pfeilii]|nr:hypothetical protein BDZ91DRAFT_711858 [Kalaharituber pfeilii]
MTTHYHQHNIKHNILGLAVFRASSADQSTLRFLIAASGIPYILPGTAHGIPTTITYWFVITCRTYTFIESPVVNVTSWQLPLSL